MLSEEVKEHFFSLEMQTTLLYSRQANNKRINLIEFFEDRDFVLFLIFLSLKRVPGKVTSQ